MKLIKLNLLFLHTINKINEFDVDASDGVARWAHQSQANQ